MFKRTSSKSSTTNTSVNTTNDNRVAADNGAIVNRGGTVTVTDGGAIRMAGEIGDKAIDAGVLFGEMGLSHGRELAEDGFAFATAAQAAQVETLEAIIDRERDDAAQLSEQLVNMIPYVVAGVVAWSIFK